MITPHPSGHAHIKIMSDDSADVGSFRCERCQKYYYGKKDEVTDEMIVDWIAKHKNCVQDRGYSFKK